MWRRHIDPHMISSHDFLYYKYQTIVGVFFYVWWVGIYALLTNVILHIRVYFLHDKLHWILTNDKCHVSIFKYPPLQLHFPKNPLYFNNPFLPDTLILHSPETPHHIAVYEFAFDRVPSLIHDIALPDSRYFIYLSGRTVHFYVHRIIFNFMGIQ